MNLNLKTQHEILTELEKEEYNIFASLEDAQYNLKMKEAHILLTTTKEEWKEKGITNESGRKAYINKETDSLLNEIRELKKELKYNTIKQNHCKRLINYHMKKMEDKQ